LVTKTCVQLPSPIGKLAIEICNLEDLGIVSTGFTMDDRDQQGGNKKKQNYNAADKNMKKYSSHLLQSHMRQFTLVI